MTLSDLMSGTQQFLVRNTNTRFFFIVPTGGSAIVEPNAANEVSSLGVINVDGELFDARLVYTTNEQQEPDSIPTIAELRVTLVNASDASNLDLIAAVGASRDSSSNPELAGAAVSLVFNFREGLGNMITTILEDGSTVTPEGVLVGTRIPTEFNQPIEFSVISSNVTTE